MNGLQKKDFLDEGNPVIHYGQIYTKYGFIAEKVLSYASDEIFSKLRKAQKNDILIATTSENVEDVGKSVVWLGEDEIGFIAIVLNKIQSILHIISKQMLFKNKKRGKQLEQK